MPEVNMERAKETFGTLCSMLDRKEWKYEKTEESLIIKSGVHSDDLPIEFFMRVNPKNEIVSFLSFLPFTVEESKRIDIALAVCAANYGMVDGSFDFNLEDGKLMFRLTSSYRNTVMSEELLEYMLVVAAGTVDKYNDKFFMVAKGMMTIQQFIEADKV